MTIFSAKSPIDRFGGDKPRLLEPAQPGRLRKFVKKFGPLLNVKSELDKVYSNGYFENYYPDADKLLKGALHEKAMDAWANADEFGSSDEPAEEKNEQERTINVVINLGS
jgi:hypothetical protein